MKDVVEICDKTFEGFGSGTTINPTKVTLDLGETSDYPPYEGFMNAMPAYVGHLDTAGMKFVGGFNGERKRCQLPYLTGIIVLIDPRTGRFTGILEGAYITNLRTGAQTALALKYIKKSTTIRIGLFGAGMQGHTQTMAISELFDIEQLTVYDINRESAEKFKLNMEPYVKGDITIADSPRQAANADAVISVTQSKDKFLRDEWIRPGTAVFPMGSYQECEDALLLNADKIIVDHIEQALKRGALKKLHKQGMITDSHIYATIGELAVQKKTITNEDDRLVCIPIGTGALDVAVAQIVLDRAIAQGKGTRFSFV
jgi:ornithine cyclodeaminase/alanine dehydrogenase